uniref:Uncharacterized protein n=1 Tax=Timema cristinae TaxID=61476 RepID=A0A7R9D8I0_TIMCR|nr:unnamed protein product [Timema cristinae]
MRKTNLKSKKGKSSDNESVVDDANENGEEDTIASRGSISGDEEDKPELKKKRVRKSGPVQGKEDDASVKELVITNPNTPSLGPTGQNCSKLIGFGPDQSPVSRLHLTRFHRG